VFGLGLSCKLGVIFTTVTICGGFRLLVSGCTKVDFVVGGGFRGFRFLGRPRLYSAVNTRV